MSLLALYRLNHAGAHETAHCLSAFDHRLTSCPAAAEPRRHAIRLRHGFIALAIAVPPAPTFVVTPYMVTVGPPPAPSAMRLPTAPAATLGRCSSSCTSWPAAA